MLNHPRAVKFVLAAIGVALLWFAYAWVTSDKGGAGTVRTPAAEGSGFAKFPDAIEKLVVFDQTPVRFERIEQNRLKYAARIKDLLDKAEKIKPDNWSRGIPAGHDKAPSLLKLTPKGDLVVNEGLQVYFAYYLDLLGATVGLEEGASRLLVALQALPPGAQAQARRVLEGYLNVEFALVEQAAQGAKNSSANGEDLLRRYREAGANNDVVAQANESRNLTLAALANQKEREQLITLHGQGGAIELYRQTTERAHNELQASFIASDVNFDERSKVAQILSLYKAPIGGVSAQDDASGRVSLLYQTVDAAVIDSSKTLSSAEKAKIRQEFFGPQYK